MTAIKKILISLWQLGNETGCNVSGDTLEYRLEESASYRHTRQVTQLFTYLLTHKLFTSCSSTIISDRELGAEAVSLMSGW